MTTLAAILRAVEAGVLPAPDLGLTVVPAPSERDSAVVAFTGHTVIAADVSAEWVAERVPEGDLGAPASPAFLQALAERTGRRAGATDAMLLSPAITDPASRTTAIEGLTALDDHDHPRVERALEYRDDVQVYGDEYGAVVITGRGLADRLECAIELPDDIRGRGHGRRLARAARALIPADASIWAQITPGNAASLRAFLAAGYQPIGSETLLST
ncbi:GNAT family N-acetyltransferase [Kribbella sp. NPDC054772]